VLQTEVSWRRWYEEVHYRVSKSSSSFSNRLFRRQRVGRPKLMSMKVKMTVMRIQTMMN